MTTDKKRAEFSKTSVRSSLPAPRRRYSGGDSTMLQVIARKLENRRAYFVFIYNGRASEKDVDVFDGWFPNALADAMLAYDQKHPGQKSWHLGKIGRKFTGKIIAHVEKTRPQALENWSWERNAVEPPGWTHGWIQRVAKKRKIKLNPLCRKRKAKHFRSSTSAAAKNPDMADMITLVRHPRPPAANLPPAEWKEAAKECYIDREDRFFTDISIADFIAKREPTDTVGWLCGGGVQGWRNEDHQITVFVNGDIDLKHMDFDAAVHQLKNQDFSPCIGVQSVSGGLHPIWRVNTGVETAEEMTFLRERLQTLAGVPGDKSAFANAFRIMKPGANRFRIVPENVIDRPSLGEPEPKPKSKPASKNPSPPQNPVKFPNKPNPKYRQCRRQVQDYRELGGPSRFPEHQFEMCPSGLAQTMLVSPRENTPRGYRMTSSGEIYHFGQPGHYRKMINPDVHGAKFGKEFCKFLIEIVRANRAAALDKMEMLAEAAKGFLLKGELIPVHIILETHGIKPDILHRIEWKKRQLRVNGKRQQVIFDQHGNDFLSAEEAIDFHRRLVSSGHIADSTVSITEYLHSFVVKLPKHKECARRLADRLLRNLKSSECGCTPKHTPYTTA